MVSGQHLISLFSATLTDPFALAYPPTIVESVRALNTAILNCWPRVIDTENSGQIARIISICWLNVHDSQGSTDRISEHDSDRVIRELQTSSEILQSFWAQCDTGTPAELRDAVRRESLLSDLFANTKTTEGTNESVPTPTNG